MNSIVPVPAGCPFTIHNIPFGTIRPPGKDVRVASAIGEYAIDLLAAIEGEFIDCGKFASSCKLAFNKSVLNDFMALGRSAWRTVRSALQRLLSSSTPLDRLIGTVLLPLASVEVLMPIHVGDYTDFYSSREHATNVGTMFRGKDNALQPNWLHLPVAYHGRASSVVPSGTPIKRPWGQIKLQDGPPVMAPSLKLDFELEMVLSASVFMISGVCGRCG